MSERITELLYAAESVLQALTRCVENADTRGAKYNARNLVGVAEEINDTLTRPTVSGEAP